MIEAHPIPFWTVCLIVTVPMLILMVLHPRMDARAALALVAAAGLMLIGYSGPTGQVGAAMGSPFALYALNRLLTHRQTPRRDFTMLTIAGAATLLTIVITANLPEGIVRNHSDVRQAAQKE